MVCLKIDPYLTKYVVLVVNYKEWDPEWNFNLYLFNFLYFRNQNFNLSEIVNRSLLVSQMKYSYLKYKLFW